jgi:protocatechuate 3,4-dioxygenase, alpha subunit
VIAPSTPSQTIGPFFGPALTWADGPFVVPQGAPLAVHITGRVYDGQGEPVADALVETWQADEHGRFPGQSASRTDEATFSGFGRSGTDREGRFQIWTVKPGRVPAPGGGLQAPHIAVSLFARGLLQRVVTRIYFGDETLANEEDPVLQSVDASRRPTLVAPPAQGGYVFDIHLQGPDETVFFTV